MMTSEYEVRFQPIGRRVDVAGGTSVFAAAHEAGIELTSACGGEGRCGLCRIQVASGNVAAPTPAELAVLGAQANAGLRLACRIGVEDDLVIHVPETSTLSGPRLQVGEIVVPVALRPAVSAYEVTMEAPTLEDPRSDLDRMLDALRAQHGVTVRQASPRVIRSLGSVFRDHGWSATAFVGRTELVGVAPPGVRPLGLAVDLGTTKIAAHLLDLSTGEDLGAAGVPNPQIAHGEDVISRLEHVRRHQDGGSHLARLAADAIDGLAARLGDEIGTAKSQIVDACVVGNTAMIHLLLQYPVGQLARAPFIAASTRPIDVGASEIGLDLAPGARVHIPGAIGGFVGADHVAMILASGIDLAEGAVLGIDIGTNTEIVLHKPGKTGLTATSCASGPAFEGAHIVDGMRASAGAIERLTITDDGVEFATIDGVPPIGLCGSGIVDAVAELRRRGLVDDRGRFDKTSRRITKGGHGPELVLSPADASGSESDVVITQHDVREIQLAKGAIHAGVEILLELTGTRPEEVEAVLIAGAFGSFLTIDSAIDIGLLPQLPRAGFRQIGNAAVVGAIRMLVSTDERLRAQQILEQTTYEELTVQPVFARRFAMGMLLPEPRSLTERTA
jgi:uncharacterized 2Fe-2S/4Fe-4S cluster protein (DUF4445 family)